MTAADLRSDTVTRPCREMRAAMARAEVGDDVYGEDPSIRALEEHTAQLLDKEAGVFFPSGTQSNLAALLTHCRRGDEYIACEYCHIYRYEAGGGAALGGISPCPLPADARKGLSAESVAAAIKEDDPHFPRTRLLCMENTMSGIVQDETMMRAAVDAAHRRGLRTHLDGARLMNAAVAQNTSAKKLCEYFDSVSLCLSKGLGAPAGTMLCGESGFIREARRNRKLLGGGMRQSGILAAAGLWALEHNIARLQQDHELAEELARGLTNISAVKENAVSCDTNMVHFAPAPADYAPLRQHWEAHGVLVGGSDCVFRLVTHRDITQEGIAVAIAVAAEYYKSRPPSQSSAAGSAKNVV